VKGHLRLVFQDRWNDRVWYAPEEVSDGTILLLAFLVLQHQQPPLDLIAIDELERGLHPYLLGELVAILRKMATGQLGPHAAQIVAATHSSDLLDFVKPEEVRFLTRQGDGTVSIERPPVETNDWATAYRNYNERLGRIWLSGSLGGVPGD
jgi:predicted ATPase